MQQVIFSLIAFIIVYLFYLITVVLQKKRYEKFRKSNQVLYFKNLYKINVDKLNMNKFTNIIALANSLIIAIAFTVFCLFDNWLLQILFGFATSFILIFICYHIIGKYYQKKEGK